MVYISTGGRVRPEVYKVRVEWWTWVVFKSPEAIKEVFDKHVLYMHSSMSLTGTILVPTVDRDIIKAACTYVITSSRGHAYGNHALRA